MACYAARARLIPVSEDDPLANQTERAFVVVGGLLRQGDSVLLVRQQKPNDPELKWALPGGYVERDESLLDALRREVHEETGLDVLKIGPLLYAVHLIIASAGATLVVLVFEIEAWCRELQPSESLVDPEEKILDAQFVPVEEAIQRLEEGFRFANEPAIEHLRASSPQGAVWVYYGDPSEGDRLVECTPLK
jgi:ADP-ribose pyrophosphatase YjhB (NUDIX family)